MDRPTDKPSDLLPLDAERRVSFKAERGQGFAYIFRRITDAEWRHFFQAIVSQTDRVGDQRTQTFDFRTAQLVLVERNLAHVEGYRMRAGSIEELPNWIDRLPYGHRVKAAELLQRVTVSEADPAGEYFFEPDVDEVSIDALWGSAAAGSMMQYKGLVHRFTPPTIEHQRRFNRAASESRVVGGSRTGRTIYPTKQGLLIDLYDELVLSVDGYSVGGEKLSTKEQIKAEMDAFHKVAAVQQLFAVPDDEPAAAQEVA